MSPVKGEMEGKGKGREGREGEGHGFGPLASDPLVEITAYRVGIWGRHCAALQGVK